MRKACQLDIEMVYCLLGTGGQFFNAITHSCGKRKESPTHCPKEEISEPERAKLHLECRGRQGGRQNDGVCSLLHEVVPSGPLSE